MRLSTWSTLAETRPGLVRFNCRRLDGRNSDVRLLNALKGRDCRRMIRRNEKQQTLSIVVALVRVKVQRSGRIRLFCNKEIILR